MENIIIFLETEKPLKNTKNPSLLAKRKKYSSWTDWTFYKKNK
jgi:hypothetical protein